MKIFHKCVLLFLFFTIKLNAQTCSNCTITINDNSVASYTLSAGQTLCVDTLGNFEGTLVINGGEVCNRGIFSPLSLVFLAGSVSNYGLMTLGANTVLATGVNVVNLPTGVINITGFLELNGGSINNQGVLNVKKSILNTTGNFFNSGILNCEHLNGVNAINNSGTINSED